MNFVQLLIRIGERVFSHHTCFHQPSVKGNSAFRVMLREDLSSSQEISSEKEMCKCSCLPSSLFQASNLTSNTDWSLFPSHAVEFVPDIKGNEKKSLVLSGQA